MEKQGQLFSEGQHTITGTFSEPLDPEASSKEMLAQESLVGEEFDEPSPEPEKEDSGFTTLFPDEWKQDFEGLTYLGRLTDTVRTIPNHVFEIKTILPSEKLEITLILKELEDSVGYARGYRAAVVAAGVVSVDGRRIQPVNKRTSAVREKYDYVINSWYEPVIDVLYNAINELEGRANQLVLQLIGDQNT